MKEKAVQILTLIKEDKSLFPGLFFLVFFLLTGYLLYPHNTPTPGISGISDSNLPSKPVSTITPTPTIYFYKKTQSIIKSIPSITAYPTNDTTEGSSITNTISPTPVPSSSNNSEIQNIPTPTALPNPSISPFTTVITTFPTITPSDNANDQTVNTTVGTIIGQVIPVLK